MHALAMYFVHGTGSGIYWNPLHVEQKYEILQHVGILVGGSTYPINTYINNY